MAKEMKITSSILPEYCYSWRPMIRTDRGMIHFVSNKYARPNDPFNVNDIVQLLLDLNRDHKDRDVFLTKDESDRYYASYHYVLPREGGIYQLAPTSHRAFHAGTGFYPGIPTNMGNAYTIGIACIGHETSGYTEHQYNALNYLLAKHNMIEVMGHEHYAPSRKVDPGKLFEWNKLQNVKIP